MKNVARLLALFIMAMMLVIALPAASASADVCNPGEIYCMPDVEIQLQGVDSCADPTTGNLFSDAFGGCSSASDWDDENGGFNGAMPDKQQAYIPFLSDVFVRLTQMVQMDAQLLLTFILVDQMSGQNVSMNPVLSCDNAQGAVKEACTGKSEWFLGQYSLMRNISIYIVIPLFFMMVIQSLIKGSLYNLLKGALVMFPLAMLGTVMVVVFMQMFLNITDDFCNYIVDRATTGLETDTCANSQGLPVTNTTCGLKNSLAEQSIGSSGLFVAFLWFFVLIAASIAIYLELLGRQIGIYMMTLLLPLVMAGLVWPRTVGLAKKIIQYELALIISKVFVVAALSLGMGAFAHTNSSKCTAFVDPATGEQSATTCGAAAGPNEENIDPENTGAPINEETQATNDNWQALASGTLIILLAAFAGAKVVTLSPAAMAGTAPVWNKGALASRGQVIAVVGQRVIQFNEWRAKNRKPGGNFSTGPKTGQGKEGKDGKDPKDPKGDKDVAPKPPGADGKDGTDPKDPDDKGKGKDKDEDKRTDRQKRGQERCDKAAAKLNEWSDKLGGGKDGKSGVIPTTKVGRAMSQYGKFRTQMAQNKAQAEKDFQKRQKRSFDKLRVGPDTMQNGNTEAAMEQLAERTAAANGQKPPPGR